VLTEHVLPELRGLLVLVPRRDLQITLRRDPEGEELAEGDGRRRGATGSLRVREELRVGLIGECSRPQMATDLLSNTVRVANIRRRRGEWLVALVNRLATRHPSLVGEGREDGSVADFYSVAGTGHLRFSQKSLHDVFENGNDFKLAFPELGESHAHHHICESSQHSVSLRRFAHDEQDILAAGVTSPCTISHTLPCR